MRKFLTIAVVALTAALGAGLADAQVRVKPMNPNVMVPKAQKAPRVQQVKPVKPNVVLLPPSAALKRAMGTVPNAKPLGVKLRGQTYVVRLKQGGTIKQLSVNSVTGAVTPLP
ncbi:hypothetical protein [Aestuariivirga sp.]|uniref:hypothetical protein n=1 Tax=Aestuariivirga sp. TaxID=2650926 RepID=UPI003593D488